MTALTEAAPEAPPRPVVTQRAARRGRSRPGRSRPGRSRRANRVSEARAVAVAYLSGAAAAFAPPSPTGRPLVDAALVGAGTAAVVYAGASAPWWALTVAAGAAAVISGSVVLLVLAGVALAGAVWVGVHRRSVPDARAAVAGLSLNVLAWAELGAPFGVTAVVAIAAAGLLFVSGMRRRPRRIRRVAWLAAGGAVALAGLAVLGFAVAAADARTSLEQGRRLAEQGIDALDRGDLAAAADHFEAASASLARADRQLGRVWSAPAAFVPVASQHRAAALELSRAGAAATADVAAALDEVDLDSLRVERGRIDLAAIPPLREPFLDIDAALGTVSGAVADARSPWLVDALDQRLDSLAVRVDEQRPRLQNAIRAVELAPGLLGGDGPRTYLVLFTTPAEARGLGGFVGNYAELTIEGGRVAMTDFGRVSDLEQRAVEAGVQLDGPAGFLARYGRFGFDRPEGGVGVASFRNLTMTPHFPWVADVASQLYVATTGTPVDGVLAMDPYVVQALVGYTGPIELETVGRRLTARNAASYLLRGQYAAATDNTTRIDALEEAAERTFRAVLGGSLPAPTTLARDLGALATERRLLVWTADTDEQDLLRRVGLLGEIPPLGGGDGWSVAVSNAGGSKIDTFLRRRAGYTSTTDPSTGVTTATLTVELTNTAPATGLPDYVIGSAVGLDPGTSRLYVSAYSPLGIVDARVDGRPVGMDSDDEVGWNVYSAFVDIPSGATVTVEVELAGRLEHPERLVTWEQPLATALEPGG